MLGSKIAVERQAWGDTWLLNFGPRQESETLPLPASSLLSLLD